MAFKLIIFDLDGTLVDSSIDIANAINYALDGMKVPAITVRQTITLIGEGITRLFEKIIENYKLHADKDMLIKRFLEHYSAHIVDNTTVYPGVKETLDALKGCSKAVISNKREDLSIQALELLGIRKFFDLVVGSDTTAERKPSPVPVQHVLSRLGVKPKDAVIIGDSNLDIEAGKAAGITTIAVTYGYRPLNILKGANHIVNSMPEIIKIVKS
ncbi:MAG TPA: HAD-IA family hydrolase [Dissulfurispiraceae bacterium]|nr:HAD-IA family hydrolase [Dissulfurispiraceae bacterium]